MSVYFYLKLFENKQNKIVVLEREKNKKYKVLKEGLKLRRRVTKGDTSFGSL